MSHSVSNIIKIIRTDIQSELMNDYYMQALLGAESRMSTKANMMLALLDLTKAFLYGEKCCKNHDGLREGRSVLQGP